MSLIRSEINLEKDFSNKEIIEKVKLAISRLPENYREVLVLKFLEDKTIFEIVDILRKSQGTIASLLRRGRSRLKKELLKLRIS